MEQSASRGRRDERQQIVAVYEVRFNLARCLQPPCILFAMLPSDSHSRLWNPGIGSVILPSAADATQSTLPAARFQIKLDGGDPSRTPHPASARYRSQRGLAFSQTFLARKMAPTCRRRRQLYRRACRYPAPSVGRHATLPELGHSASHSASEQSTTHPPNATILQPLIAIASCTRQSRSPRPPCSRIPGRVCGSFDLLPARPSP